MDGDEPVLCGKEIEILDRSSSPRRNGYYGHLSKSGQHIHIPSDSHILEKLYNDNGIRVRMLRRGRPNKIPTVRELIENLAKKHEGQLQEFEAIGSRVKKPSGLAGQLGRSYDGAMNASSIRGVNDTMRCMSETQNRIAAEVAERDEIRCLSERPTRSDYYFNFDTGVTGKSKEQASRNKCSSSTPTVPYSTADILYGNEVNGGSRSVHGDDRDLRQHNGYGETDRGNGTMRQKTSKELEQHPNNKRPRSKSGKQKSLSIDTVTPFDKDREDSLNLKSLSTGLPSTKPTHHFRSNGIKSGIVKAEQHASAKTTNGAVSGREQDDLVAMGTLWSPNNGSGGQSAPPTSSANHSNHHHHTPSVMNARVNGSVANINTNSYPSKASSTGNTATANNNLLSSQRKYPSTGSMRPIVVQNNISGKKTTNSPEDPKYTDPMIGSPASFQQRIIELGALEGDTVRWERSKRLKKKKTDRDS